MDAQGEGRGRESVNVDVEYKLATMLPCLQKRGEKCANDKDDR